MCCRKKTPGTEHVTFSTFSAIVYRVVVALRGLVFHIMYDEILLFYKNVSSSYIKPTLAKIRIIYYHWGNIPYFLLFTMVKFIFWAFQYITWKMTGVKEFCDKINRGECYEKSAHVLTVISSCKATPFEKPRDKWYYLTIHNSFQHPHFVLSDDIMLIDVTTSKAVFVQLPKPLDQYTIKNVKFLFIETVSDAISLIEMPLASLQRLADEIGDPTDRYDKITFLFNSGRCGSTAVASMIQEADPEALVFSEPTGLMECVYYKMMAPSEFYRKQLRNALFLLFKPMLVRKRVYVKLTFFHTYIAKDIYSVLPKARYIYIDRDLLSVIWSSERAFGYGVWFRLMYWAVLSRLFPFLEKHWGHPRTPQCEHAYGKLKNSNFEFWTLICTYLLWRYKQQAEQFEFPLIFYDDLFENPTKFCRNVLQLLDLPESRLNAVMFVLKEDSQDGTILGQIALRNVPVTMYSLALKRRTDAFFDILNLPRLNWEPYELKCRNTYVSPLRKVSKLWSLNATDIMKPLPIQCVVASSQE